MNNLKWGLIGCGDLATNRIAPAIVALDGNELVAVSRENYDLAESFASKFGAKRFYRHWQELLKDKDIDAVYIATPVNMHAEQTIAAANAGKHVLCEKPMAISSSDGQQMVEACKSNNVTLGIAYYRQFYPIVARIKEILNKGEIGKVISADIHAFEWFNRRPDEPRSWLLDQKQSGGGPMMDFGCHRIELLQYLLGAVTEVHSHKFNALFERDVEDSAYVSMVHENNCHSLIRVSHAAFEAKDTLQIYGSEGSINVAVLNEETLQVTTREGMRIEKHPRDANSHVKLIADFSSAVIQNALPSANTSRSIAVSEVLDIIYSRARPKFDTPEYST